MNLWVYLYSYALNNIKNNWKNQTKYRCDRKNFWKLYVHKAAVVIVLFITYCTIHRPIDYKVYAQWKRRVRPKKKCDFQGLTRAQSAVVAVEQWNAIRIVTMFQRINRVERSHEIMNIHVQFIAKTHWKDNERGKDISQIVAKPKNCHQEWQYE